MLGIEVDTMQMQLRTFVGTEAEECVGHVVEWLGCKVG